MLNRKLYNITFDSCSKKTLFDQDTLLERVILKEDKSIEFKENSIRDVIADFPEELVIDPCREAKHVPYEEKWYLWKTEHEVSAGKIDVLLLSSEGRIGIIEVKLSKNPDGRRKVVSQIADYAVSLKELDFSKMPEIPVKEGSQVASKEEIIEHMRKGDHLLIIAGDSLDEKMIKLSDEIIAKNLTNPWSLVLIELALYSTNNSENQYLVVPYVRQIIDSERRHVIEVEVNVKNEDPTQVATPFSVSVTSNSTMSTVSSKSPFNKTATSPEEFQRKLLPDQFKLVSQILDNIRHENLIVDWAKRNFAVRFQHPYAPKQTITLFLVDDKAKLNLWIEWPKDQASKIHDVDQELVGNYINDLITLLGNSYVDGNQITASLTDIKDKIPNVVELANTFASEAKLSCKSRSS